ncbi:outer membrane beta-barrel protein [uncultured Alsobacter sp.]|uniref:outer membrane protein n=1 Tax=uncultured Alsobacter sp. TaxID=1748258 RepID=UPI0025F58929|nr:outer membrane beta-barrel protein [uncultured Alsobacter sp.]
MAGVATATKGQAGETSARPSWSGVYGGFMGAASNAKILGSTLKADFTVGSNASQESAVVDDDAKGAGVFLGFRKHLDQRFVVGVEADVLKLGHTARTINLIGGSSQPVAMLKYEVPWLSTLRAVAGVSFADILLYGTGGLAVAGESERRTQYRLVAGASIPAFTEASDATRMGLALGAGIEWRIAGAWSLRAEWLHAHFPREVFAFPDARGGAQASFASVQGRIARNTADVDVARIGITYTFGLFD